MDCAKCEVYEVGLLPNSEQSAVALTGKFRGKFTGKTVIVFGFNPQKYEKVRRNVQKRFGVNPIQTGRFSGVYRNCFKGGGGGENRNLKTQFHIFKQLFYIFPGLF